MQTIIILTCRTDDNRAELYIALFTHSAMKAILHKVTLYGIFFQ